MMSLYAIMDCYCKVKKCLKDVKERLSLLEGTPTTSGSFCAFGYIDENGDIITQGGDYTVTRLSTGRYQLTYGTPLQSIVAPVLGNAESYSTRDSITIRYDNVSLNGFEVHISEGDNGTTANVPVDRQWSFAVPCGDPVGTTIAGPQGPAGADGVDGVDGQDGADGADGVQGPPGQDNSSGTIEVDQTDDATFSFNPVDIHNNGATVALTNIILDTGFARTGNVITYTGTPEKINIDVSVNAEDAGASNYWSRPKMRVLRGGSVIAVFDDLVMQQNGAYDGDFTLTGTFLDKQPGANPSYTFEWFDEDARTATLIPNSFSQLSLTATNKVTVLI